MITAILKHSELKAALNQRSTVHEGAQKQPNATSAVSSQALSKVWRVLAVGGIVIAGTFGAPRLTNYFAAASDAAAQLPEREVLPLVSTIKPFRSQQAVELALPAEIDAYQSTSAYARIRGYLKSWKVDRGDRVIAGQVLAVIDAPEFDQDLRRAEADLQQGKAEVQQARTELAQSRANVESADAQVVRADANVELTAKTAERYKSLVGTWAASQQQYDEAVRNYDVAKAELVAATAEIGSRKAAVESRQAAIHTAEARVNSLAANVQRLKETESFKTVTAPYNGTITRRFVDVGAYITDDGTKPLFTIIQDDLLRVRVNVPQTYTPSIKPEQTTALTLRELPGRKFTAKVTRTARAIDPVARTLTVELELANSDNMILPGSFAQVKFSLNVENAPLSIPASALKMTKGGAKVVVVGNDQRLRTQKIELGRDLGSRIEVTAGLNGDELLVINPAESLTDGSLVESTPSVELAAK
jgi:multidrug efflux pump subunit AcrA (membrane-fusion protein)